MPYLPSHDHTIDEKAGPEATREAAYRRGCDQAISMAIHELQRREIAPALWEACLVRLEKVLMDMRSERKKDYPAYLDQAMQRAWGAGE